MKILISIILVGMINFVFEVWIGCVSDKFIILNFGFLNIIEFYDKVMVDRGFFIREEFILLRVEFLVFLGRWGVF